MPAGKTYTRIASQTTTGSVQTVTFSNLPQNFTDLVCVMQVVSSSSNTLFMRFNSNTGSNYSATRLSGSGTSAVSDRDSSATYGLLSNYAYPTSTAGNTNTILQIQNYSNKTTNKSFLVRSNSAGAGVDAIVGLWRQTSAIDSISFSTNGFTSSTSISSGSIFTLYGIAASKVPQAVGGTITTDGSYWIHTFTSSGLFIPQQSINNVDYLVVAGGGGGGVGGAGAGGLRSTVTATGGGGSLETALSCIQGTTYTVTVGAGGNGMYIPGSGYNQGSNSVFSTITSTGGGGGGRGGSAGGDGGSGGGGGYTGNGTLLSGGSGTTSQGYAGGSNNSYTTSQGPGVCGGGGGAGAVGQSAPSASTSGTGGIGVATSITGTSTYYAGGGGGGSYTGGALASGGSGGGGNAGTSAAGTANTGGGGGGYKYDGTGGNGGSGIVIVRYPI